MSSKNRCYNEIEVTSRLLNIILDMSAEQQLSLLDRKNQTGGKDQGRHARRNLKKQWVVQVEPEKGEKQGGSFINDISRCGVFIEFIESSEIDNSFFCGPECYNEISDSCKQKNI